MDASFVGEEEDMRRACTRWTRRTRGPAAAAGSIAFRKADPAYSKRLLDRPVEVFKFADKHCSAYSSSLHPAMCPFYCDYDRYQDELLWGTPWLHKATQEKNEMMLDANKLS